MSNEIETAGTYKMRAVDHEFGVSPIKGTDYVKVRMVVEDEYENGSEIDWYGYLSDAAMKYTVKNLKTLGWTGQDIENLPGLGTPLVSVVVETESYDGKDRLKVKWINELGEGVDAVSPMHPSRKAAFAAKMRGAIAAEFGAGALKAPAPKPVEDDFNDRF